jgi:hypothetical protein
MNKAVNINITTSSKVINFSQPFPPAAVPTITIDGVAVPKPSQAPSTPTGYQVLVFDATKSLTDPLALIANQYACVYPSGSTNSWMSTYQYCYDQIYTILLNAGNVDQQIRMIVSFGLDGNMPPTNNALALLLQTGGDGQLQYWEQHCNPGSQVGNASSWVAYPVSYILLGASGWGYGQGFETFLATAGAASLAVSMPS